MTLPQEYLKVAENLGEKGWMKLLNYRHDRDTYYHRHRFDDNMMYSDHNPVYDEILDNYDLFDRLKQFFMFGE